MIRVLIVPADEAQPIRDTWIEPDLESIRAALGGGWLEGVGSPDADWHAYCDEEGKLKGLPVNVRATRMARMLGWPTGDTLVGDVIFLGHKPVMEDGFEVGLDEDDVPKHVLELAVTMYRSGVKMIPVESSRRP
jgi:hypothetical protein